MPVEEKPVRSLVMLMMEEELPEGLSARKLVMETSKHNVLTAYSAGEGLDLLRRFPAIDAVLLHAGVIDRKPGLIRDVRVIAPSVPIIVASPGENQLPPLADYVIDSHKPHVLVQLLANELQANIDN
jgi:hypothetical protein